MVFTDYEKRRILHFKEKRCSLAEIVKCLNEENISASKTGVWSFLKKYNQTGECSRKKGSGAPTIINEEVRELIDTAMDRDDETTAVQLKKMLNEHGYDISLSTILRCRRSLGWTFRGSAYCQLIRQQNKEKRLAWAVKYLPECETGFKDVIYTDETSVQLEPHRRHSFRRKGAPPPPTRASLPQYFPQQMRFHSNI